MFFLKELNFLLLISNAMRVRASRKMTSNPRPTWLSASALDQQLTQICAPGAPPTRAPSPESASGESRRSPPGVPVGPLAGKEFSSAQGERRVGWAARPRCRPLTRRSSPPGPGPPLRTWPCPHQASPSSGSASGSASRGRGFNNCSSCSARDCGPAMVPKASPGAALVNVALPLPSPLS